MKALKRGSRANRRGSATGVNESVGSDSSGFNAKVLGRTSGGFDETGKRKMKLNLKPLRTPVGAPKPKVGETTKKAPLPNMSLRARLALANRPAIAEAGEHDTKNLMDDQSVASFGYEDSERIRSTLDSARARSSAHNPDVKGTQQQLRSTIGPTSLGHNHASIAAANKAIAAKKGLSTSLVVRSDSKRSTTTESNDMFDTFTQQRRSSLNNTTVADPFGNSDAFSSFTGDTNPKVPAVQRASVIDEDTQSASDTSIMQSDSRGRGKKSKMQKITELLDDKKEWKEKNRALRREIASMEERIDELEAKLEESGDIGTRAEVLRSVAEQDEKLKKTKKELDRVQKESKVLKKQLASKKIELLTMEKERDANMSEVSTLRKELSQALQQVDMLEEEQEGDKEKILKLTKELTHAKEGRDDQSEKSEDDQTMQVQLEVFERKTKKKDRQLEKQRIEVEDQVEHLLRLKAELERAQKLLRDNDDIENRLVELTESNNDLKDQVDTKVRELEDMERFQADTINLQASQLQASERKRKQLLEELKESREEVDDLQQQKTLLVAESTSPASRAIGESEEVVEELRRNLSAGSDELSASKRENKEFQERIAELEKQNSEVQSKLANFGSQSRALNGSLAELRQENSSLGATITELKEKITKEEKGRAKRETSLSSQISSLRSSLDASQNLHQQSENDEKKVVSEMQTKLAETELALEEMKLYNEELEASAEELRETSSDFEQELQRLLEERDAQHAKVEQLHQELEEAGKSAEAIEAMQGRLVEVEDQAFLLNEKNQTLERHLAQVTEENEYLKENVVEVENDAAEAQQAVSALEELMEEYDELQDEAQEMRDKSASLEGEAKRMKSELEEWQGVAERAEEEVKESQEVLALAEETQKDLEALQVEADEARQQSAQVQRKLDEVSTEREVLSLSLQTIEEQLEGTQATVTALEDERSRLLAVESEAMELREYKESAEASIEELHHERDEWMETAKEARAEAKTKQAAISALKESNHEYSDYEVEAAELRAIVDSNETKIDQLIQDRDEYKVASQKAEAELQKTQTELNALEEMVEEFELLQEESEQLRQDKADLESQIEELILEKGEGEKAALQATTDTEEAQALVQANRKELAEKETESSELIHKNTDLVVEVSELQASIDDLKRKAAQAEAYSLEADTTRKDHVEYQERLRESEGVVIELRESNEELIMELENLNNEHEKLMHESDLMKTELTETRHLIHALENTVEDYEVLQEELTSLNADYSRVEQELEERRERTKTIESEVSELKSRNFHLERQLESLSSEKDELKTKTAELDTELVETKQQLEAARANSDVVLQDADRFQEEKDKLASNLEDLTAERNHLAEKNMKVQLLLADKDASLATLQETTRSRDSLQDEVEQLKQQNDEGLSQIQILTGERDNWKTKAKKSQQLANEAETSVQALQEQMEQMRNAERYSVDGEMKSVQIQIDGLLTERTELKTALAREQNSVATAETEISSLRGSLAGMASLQIEIDRLATSNADLSSQLASLAAQRDELQSSVAVSESRSIEAKSAMSSLEAERDKDAETLRQQNTQVMAQSAALQSEQAKLNALASRFEQVESALEESKHALTESEKRFADLESQHQAVETKVGDLLAERNELQAAVEKATLDLIAAETLASSSSDVEKECAVLLKNFTALGEDVEEAQKQRLAAEERLQDLSTERDRLLESIAIAEAKSEAAEQELASVDVSGLQKESAKFRDRLKLSPEDDAVGTLEQLQQDYSDLLDDNYRLRENLGDYEAEIDELVGERDEWMAQAQKKTPVTSPETSRSTAETQGMDGMQELCEELQRQLQSITRDRDIWKETAESATRTGNKGERRGRSRSVARDDSSVMSDMSDQKMLLQQAIEYRDRRDGKKSSSMFSFGGRRASKFESDPGANEPDREELIDQLTEAQEQNERTISQLKTEVFELNKSLKEDVYSNKKKTEAIEQENSAYELKVMVLEQELERLSSEVGASQGPEDTERIRSLQRDLTNFQNEKKDVEQEIASLQTHFDKLHRASTQEVVHKQTKIDHLKTLQDDFQAKIDALENMMLAIDKENETLREIAQKAGNFSIDSDLGRVLAENDKDVKIAQLHNQLVELRMQGHQQLTDKVLQLQDEKLQMQAVMEEHFQIVAEENESILEDLEMRLSAREQTIKQLESMLDQRNGVGGASLSGTSHSGESR